MDELDFKGWNDADWEGAFARQHTDDVVVEVHGQPPHQRHPATHGCHEGLVQSTGGTPIQAKWRDGAIAEEYIWI